MESVFYGHLAEVDFSANTAILEEGLRRDGIRLEFADDLRDDFKLLDGKYVRVSGEADYTSYEDGGDLVSPLRVGLIQDLTPGSGTPDPRTVPKIFDPSKVRKASWDFDAEEFIWIIKEGRHADMCDGGRDCRLLREGLSQSGTATEESELHHKPKAQVTLVFAYPPVII